MVLKIVLVMVEKCINRERTFSRECRIQLHFLLFKFLKAEILEPLNV